MQELASSRSYALSIRSSFVSLMLLGLSVAPQMAFAGLVVSDLSTQTPTALVQRLVGNNVPFSNVTYTGAQVASGSFSGGSGIIGFEDGVLLTSGDVRNVVGPNSQDGKSTVNATPGDADLEKIITGTTDAAVLEFDFVPSENTVTFEYVFTSEEYNEFANSEFNDVFAFYLNGSNVALIPSTSTPVAINTVNGGNPFGTDAKNPQFYRNNDLDDGGGSIDTEMDGLTVVFSVRAKVVPNQTNHIKLVIADVSDSILDSAVFIRSNSFIVTPAAGQFRLAAANYEINEGNSGTSTQTVTVERIGGTDGTVTVNYATSNGTARGGGSCGGDVDFVNTSGSLTFAAGQTSQTFTVAVCGDTTVEPNETITVTLSNPTGGATLGTPATGRITIISEEPPNRFANISTRLRVETGEDVLIGGFIIAGDQPKKVLVRGLGPTLPGVRPDEALADPTLTLVQGDGPVLFNDNWKDSQEQEIRATTIPPANDREAAIVATLPAGPNTVALTGRDGGMGIGLVEVYDLESGSAAQLANISTRGRVQTGDNVMIAGFIITGDSTARVLMRALGPSLEEQGVSDTLDDPTLELVDPQGNRIGNDNWRDTQEAEIAAILPPRDDREAALLVTLPRGAYTAIVRGKNDTTGVALVEGYNLDSF
jgi:hypothetical protein